MICLAYPKNTSPSCEIIIPLLVLLNIFISNSFSTSCIWLVKEGCAINNFCAALDIDPSSATVITYFICCNVILFSPSNYNPIIALNYTKNKEKKIAIWLSPI